MLKLVYAFLKIQLLSRGYNNNNNYYYNCYYYYYYYYYFIRSVLGNVKYFRDVTLTHTDEKYMVNDNNNTKKTTIQKKTTITKTTITTITENTL